MTTEDSQATLVATSSLASVASTTTPENDATVEDVRMSETQSADTNVPQRHFEAAFRGRAMHGTLVDLPKGYAGVVFRVADDGKNGSTAAGKRRVEEEKPKSRTRGRASRRAKKAQMEEVIDVDEQADDPSADVQEEENQVRVLRPTGKFGSFVLWNPDIPAEEGRDEYMRSLTEWTRLAAEVSSCFCVS